MMALPGAAFATGSGSSGTSGTDEILADSDLVAPNVIFVVDASEAMDSPCDGVSSNSCLTDTLSAIRQVIRHFDYARYGVVATAPDGTTDTYTEIAPVGSSYAQIAAALASFSPSGSPRGNNLSEVVSHLSRDYLEQTDVEDFTDGDGDGNDGDWGETPITATCSDTYIIILSNGEPTLDLSAETAFSNAPASPDVTCDDSSTAITDDNCTLDNTVFNLYYTDESSLDGFQRTIVNLVGLNLASGSTAESLLSNTADQTSGTGMYTNVVPDSSGLIDSGDILAAILQEMSDIQSGTYSRSAPVISADGAYMIYSFYELTGDNPLAEGHVRAYSLDDDPTSSTYGQVDYEAGFPEYGGALWDAGDLLVCRPVTAGEDNPDDRDGVGHRDIYFYEDAAYADMSLMNSQYARDRRLPLDHTFVTDVSSSTFDLYMDDSTDSSTGALNNDGYDLTLNGAVDSDDLQALVDFTRGLPTSTYRYIDKVHGTWKLGDSPYSTPVVVTARDERYSAMTSYRNFLSLLEAEDVPAIVLIAANDGMLHAFRLQDNTATGTEDEEGEELWAWVPGYLMLRDHQVEWAGNLIDMMWYGRTFLFDGSPVVEDVWIDEDNDGIRECDTDLDLCEWHRVVVVQQGLGGPMTLALDITYSDSPKFLWEQTNEADPYAMGYTTGRPAIFDVYDSSGSTPKDRWVAMWGGGRAAPFTGDSGNAYYQSSEANLYMWAVADDAWTGGMTDAGYSTQGDNAGNRHPDYSGYRGGEANLDYDLVGGSDSGFEYGYISAAIAAIDVDADGDGDVLYFPVTTPYTPTDEGGSGKASSDDPGSSWMYKAVIDVTHPSDLEWCNFYDPYDGNDGATGSGIGSRPEVFYSATTAWLGNGNLGIYWGTGTPFDRSGSETGYFFAMYDEDPTSCSSTAQPIDCSGDPSGSPDGYYTLNAGEGLTSDPIVYAGVVYFSTYTPNLSDECSMGTGRVYGIRYDDCTPGLDTDGDGEATAADDSNIEVADNYVSNVAVGANGTLYYGTANPTTDGSAAAVDTFGSVTDSFLGTSAVSWMEVY